MFEISVTRTFCASHQVRFANGVLEPMHGHNWTVTVSAGALQLNADGFVIDFHDLEQQLDAVLRPLNNAHLNDARLLDGANQSAEVVCQKIGQALRIRPPAWLISVAITEAPGCVATYRPEAAPQPNYGDLNG